MMKAVKACSVLLALVAALIAQPPTATARQASRPASTGFSFAVYGDSRSMMYLPYKSDQEAEARKLIVDMFELVLPSKVSEDVVQKDVRLTYDPATQELVQMVMPFMTASEVTTLTFDKGWVIGVTADNVRHWRGMHL